MPATMAELGIDRLTPAQRLSLAEEIWDSISGHEDVAALTDAQRNDLERRVAEYDANPSGSSWDDVKARLRAGS